MKFNCNNETKQRLDQFLKNEIHFMSREKIKTYIKNGFVKVNSSLITKPNHSVISGDIIFLEIQEEEDTSELRPWVDGIMPEIIFECDDYMIINKPNGLVVHPGIGNIENTLVNILLAQDFPLSKKSSSRPGIVHRIDKRTTGLMIIAKTDKFHDFVAEKFADGGIEKKYELITDGKYKTGKGIIEAPIGRDKNNRKLMKATLHNSKPAKSIFRVIDSFKDNEYVEFMIMTGRTHQIRVHSKFIGAPILNDPEYGKNTFDPEFGQYLHAKELSFNDMDGVRKIFKVKPPQEMISKLEELKGIR